MRTVTNRDDIASVVTRPTEVARPVQPVQWWAAAGAVILIVNVALVFEWVTGPRFARIPQGPDSPPGWMRAALMGGQILLPLVAVGVLYWLLVRPWRTQRRLTYDGLVALAGLTVSIWDPFSSIIQPWFGYNSYLVSFGSPISGFPGWMSLNEPGQTLAWPFPFMPALYATVLPLVGMVGCAVLRWARRTWPEMRTPGLLAVCTAVMIVVEIIFEGVIFMPLGFWSYPGGWSPVTFGGHYFQLPLNELLHVTAIFTVMSALRHFANDKGLTFPERGADHLTPGRHNAARALAVIAAVHAVIFACYHLPQTYYGANSRAWIADVNDRSYLLNQCGPHLDRACPGPGVPLPRSGSGHLDWSGHWVEGR